MLPPEPHDELRTNTITIQLRLKPAIREQYDVKFTDQFADWLDFYTTNKTILEPESIKRTYSNQIFEFRIKPPTHE